MTPAPRKLPDKTRHAIRLNHYSIRTQKTTIYWSTLSTLYHNWPYPLEMGEGEQKTPRASPT